MKKKSFYVEMDASDSSITFSKALCKDLNVKEGITYIYMFSVVDKDQPKDRKVFAFKRVKEAFTKVAACEILSKNPVTKTMGIMGNNPTVAYMLYAMKIDQEKVKLQVEKKELPTGGTIYKICYDGDAQ